MCHSRKLTDDGNRAVEGAGVDVALAGGVRGREVGTHERAQNLVPSVCHDGVVGRMSHIPASTGILHPAVVPALSTCAHLPHDSTTNARGPVWG